MQSIINGGGRRSTAPIRGPPKFDRESGTVNVEIACVDVQVSLRIDGPHGGGVGCWKEGGIWDYPNMLLVTPKDASASRFQKAKEKQLERLARNSQQIILRI